MGRGGDTRDRILDVAQEAIQRRGYSAVSFDRIAREVGIRKPSVVHHFPTKAALGVAVVRRYRDYFGAALEELAADPDRSAAEALDRYFDPYRDFGEDGSRVCLCGALAGELMALPDDLREEVRAFFGHHIQWLTDILARGRRGGEFAFELPPEQLAGMILDAAQGALIVQRATGRTDHLTGTLEALKADILPRP